MFVCPECGFGAEGSGACPTDDAELLPALDDPLLGLTVGSFRLARLIGQGTFGRVYLGVHPTIGSRVAIKVLVAVAAQDSRLVERFFAEARAVNVIRHEAIVNVFDMAALPDGRPYIVMECLEGVPLSAIIQKRGELPLGSLARLMCEALGGLDAAHQKGIVHRDLKPDNLFVTTGGRAKLLDFGIAKLTPESGLLSGPATHSGALLGTPSYMAPEQALAQPVDARTDIYAAGAILFEGATGSLPFVGTSLLAVLRAHLETLPPPPRSRRPEIPEAYERVILRALAKEPRQRFASAAEMIDALTEASATLPDEAYTPLMPSTLAMPRLPESRRAERPASVAPGRVGLSETLAAADGRAPSAVPRAKSRPQIGPERRATLPLKAPALIDRVLASTRLRWGAAALLAVIGAVVVYLVLPGDGAKPSLPTIAPGAPDALASSQGAPPEPNASTTPVQPTPPGPFGGPVPPATEPRPPTAERAPESPRVRANRAGVVHGPNVFTGPRVVVGKGSREITLPVDYDPRAFDVVGYLPRALAHARRLRADVALTHFEVSGVYSTGLANLTLSTNLDATYRFRSPSLSRVPPGTPRGVTVERLCMVYVVVRGQSAEAYSVARDDCHNPYAALPRCRTRQIWARALAKGASRGNVVAKIEYGRGWQFATPGQVALSFDDGC